MRKISASPEFDPRTVQPVASRYTDYFNMYSSYQVFYFKTSEEEEEEEEKEEEEEEE